jgi:hypothetical protein
MKITIDKGYKIKQQYCNLPVPFGFGDFGENDMDKREVTQKLISEGWAIRDIAKNLGISVSTAHYWSKGLNSNGK